MQHFVTKQPKKGENDMGDVTERDKLIKELNGWLMNFDFHSRADATWEEYTRGIRIMERLKGEEAHEDL